MYYQMSGRRIKTIVSILNAYTVVLGLWFVLAFLTKHPSMVSRTAIDVYLLILTYYVSDKEINRWRHRHAPKQRRGELFVYGWAGALLLMLAADIFTKDNRGFEIPEHLIFVAVAVLILYFITEYLKITYHRHHRRNHWLG